MNNIAPTTENEAILKQLWALAGNRCTPEYKSANAEKFIALFHENRSKLTDTQELSNLCAEAYERRNTGISDYLIGQGITPTFHHSGSGLAQRLSSTWPLKDRMIMITYGDKDTLNKAWYSPPFSQWDAELAKAMIEGGVDPDPKDPGAPHLITGLIRAQDEFHSPDFQKRFATCVAVTTSPSYPVKKRNHMHQLLLEAFDERFASGYAHVKRLMDQSEAYAYSFSPKAGSEKKSIYTLLGRLRQINPDIPKANDAGGNSFACMMHVIMLTHEFTRHNMQYTAHSSDLETQYEDNMATTLELLKPIAQSGNWQEASQRLSKYPIGQVLDITDMLNAYVNQVALPNVRHYFKERHQRPDDIAWTPYNLEGFSKEIAAGLPSLMQDELRCKLMKHMVEGKTLADMLELSQKWHANVATLDSNIRTILRTGTWYPLLAEHESIAVPSDIAKGWTIKNITDGETLARIGENLHICIGGRVDDCTQGRYHVFAFCDPDGIPKSTLRVKIGSNEKGDIPVKEKNALHIEDHTNAWNHRNFSPEESAAYEWFKHSLANGEVKLQYERIGELAQSKDAQKANEQYGSIELAIGFPLMDKKTDEYHQRAFENWAGATNALKPKEGFTPDRIRGKKWREHATVDPGPLNNENKIAHGYTSVGPDIGTKDGKFLIPEAYRNYQPEDYFHATGQDVIIHNVLAHYAHGLVEDIPARELPWSLKQKLEAQKPPTVGLS